MKRFTDAGRQALRDKNFYAALSSALIIPDVCGSLENPGAGKSKERYESWCKQWFESKYTTATLGIDGKPFSWVTAQQVYQLRCSLIHSGSDEIDPTKRTGIDRFYFFDTDGMQRFENCIFNGVQENLIRLSAVDFCGKLFAAADEWDAAVANDPKIQAEKSRLLFIYSKGAVIHGITFG